MKLASFLTKLIPVSLLAWTAFSPVAQAQTAEVITAGSSAQWGVFAAAAFKLAGTGAKHYTVKNSALLRDERADSIPDEPGNLWVVWSSDSSKVWAYLSVDSTIGVRAFESVPRAHLIIPSATTAAGNALNVWSDGSTDQASIPTAIFDVLNDKALTAVNTDIRPEDALYATNRGLATTANGGLAYSITNGVQEAAKIGSSVFHISPFVLTGSDPITHEATDPFVTIPVGAAPIVFLANASNTTAGHLGNSTITNLEALSTVGTNNAAKLFSGTECDSTLLGSSTNVAINPVLREPVSGTMNTTEFTTFQVNGGSSQENGVTGAAATNPLQHTCTSGGTRYRAIGTGDVVKAVSGIAPTGQTPFADGIGYIFFSYEAAPTTTIGTANSYKYLKLDNHDPLITGTYTGTIPPCSTVVGSVTVTNCAATITSSKYNSFPTLRAGTYTAWSVYRMIADFDETTNINNAQTLVNQAQTVVDTTLPDFVPLAPACDGTGGLLADEPGLQLYRKHFAISSTFGGTAPVVLPIANPPFNPTVSMVEQPNDGPNLFANSNPTGLACGRNTYFSGYLGGVDPSFMNTEVGGDVGGAVVSNVGATSNASVPGSTEPSPH